MAGFPSLPEDAQTKMKANWAANMGKVPHETPDFLQSLAHFDLADVNKDGRLEKDEYLQYWKHFMAHQDELYGAHSDLSAES